MGTPVSARRIECRDHNKVGMWSAALPDGRVEAQVEGPRGQIEKLLDLLRTGPPRALVTDLKITWKASARGSQQFLIVD